MIDKISKVYFLPIENAEISDEEVEFLFGLEPEEGATYLLENYPIQLVYVTGGAKGCYFKNKNTSGWVSSLNNINVVDTTGAGDIFGGSACHKLLELDVDSLNNMYI